MSAAKMPVAVVTGGAHRLGAAISAALAHAGYAVVVHYNSSRREALATATEIRRRGGVAEVCGGDLTRASKVDALLAFTLRRFRRVDALIANAGAFERTPLATLTNAQWERMLSLNLRTTLLCAQRFGLQMRNAGSGCIVALSDVAGLRPWREFLAYNIAKAGVNTLVETLAKELAPQVRVNAVAPGPVLFPPRYPPAARRREIARTLLEREGRPDNVADAVVALIRNDYITGVILPVDGGRLLA